MQESMRTAFEAWIDPDGEWPRALERNGKGEYLLVQTAQAWTAWQAGWSARTPSVEGLVELLRDALHELGASDIARDYSVDERIRKMLNDF